MNQLLHNFTKVDRLSAQITACVEKFSAQYTAFDSDEIISCQIENVEQRDWQSATYDGEIYHYIAKIYTHADKIIDNDNYRENLTTALHAYEFNLSKSFVAAITIKDHQASASAILTLDIEALIIHEE